MKSNTCLYLPLLQQEYSHAFSLYQHTSSSSHSSRDNVGRIHQMLSSLLAGHSEGGTKPTR